MKWAKTISQSRFFVSEEGACRAGVGALLLQCSNVPGTKNAGKAGAKKGRKRGGAGTFEDWREQEKTTGEESGALFPCQKNE